MTQQEALEREFPREMEGTVRKGGSNLTYIPVAEIINRLNEVLGVGGWNWEIGRIWRDEKNPEWVLAIGNLTATIDGTTATKSGSGGVQVKHLKDKPNEPVDLGDEFKGAESDALKKAAQRFGVGLYLGRRKEAIAYEEPQPVRDYATEGWESDGRWQQMTNDLNTRIKAQPDFIRKAMRIFRDDQQFVWPPSLDDWNAMNERLAELIEAYPTDPQPALEAPLPPPVPNDPPQASQGVTAPPPMPTQREATNAVKDAFPGSEDVTPITPEMHKAITDHLAFFKEREQQASRNAVKKFMREMRWPDQISELTMPQAGKVLDFIENL